MFTKRAVTAYSVYRLFIECNLVMREILTTCQDWPVDPHKLIYKAYRKIFSLKFGVFSPLLTSAEEKGRLKLFLYSPSGMLEGKFYYYLGLLFYNISLIPDNIWIFHVMNKEICLF